MFPETLCPSRWGQGRSKRAFRARGAAGLLLESMESGEEGRAARDAFCKSLSAPLEVSLTRRQGLLPCVPSSLRALSSVGR